MTNTRKIDIRGRVTIPAAIRKRAGLLPGVDITVEFGEGEVRLSRAPEHLGREQDLVSHLRGKGDVELTTDQILTLTRGE